MMNFLIRLLIFSITLSQDISTNNMTEKIYITTDSGLTYYDIKIGEGKLPNPGDILSVHYTGKLKDGTIFDSSVQRGQPIEFPIGQGRVIKGWDEALSQMRVGEKRSLIIPPDLAYGASAKGPIPANSTLIFEVELVEIK